MQFITKASVAAIALMLTGQSAWSADNELYAAPPPEDAAFLRWIGEEDAPDVMGIASLGQSGAVFHPVSAALTDGAEAGAYYTAARNAAGEIVIIEEPQRGNRSKILVTLLNLTDAPVRLVMEEQDIEVIGATAADAAGGREVNPVPASVAVVSDAGALGRFDLKLRRGQNVTFVAHADGATLIENSFGENLDR